MAIEKVILVSPRGFCAGVDRAISIVEEALRIFGRPVYVKHEIVHNRHVCDELREKGAVFVEEISEIPANSVAIFSAHGVAPKVREEARAKNLRQIDATCPLVAKIHIEVEKYAREGKQIIYIGHKGHPEAVGVMGVRPEATQIIERASDIGGLKVNDPSKLVFLTQTTLSVSETKETIRALKEKFPLVSSPPSEDICYATTNRQAAITGLAKNADVILVVGSKTSSNSNRLVETARSFGVEAHLLDDVSELKEEWLEGKKIVGISAGASAPEFYVNQIADYFKSRGAKVEELRVIEENLRFVLSPELKAYREKLGAAQSSI